MKRFLFVTWNVLATAYIRRAYYPHTPARCLDAAWRHPRIAARARELDADVLCLQEVEPVVFEAITSALAPLGYAGVHALKASKPDGCAVFVRSSRSSIARERRVVYGDGSGHIAQMVVLEDAGARIAIANTHLKWDPPGTPDEKSHGLRQAREAVAELAREDAAMKILCGDLNVTPEHRVMTTLLDSGLRDAHDAHHETGGFTSNANGVAKRIDFVLTTSSHITPLAPKPITNETALPSEDEPSDHLPLVVMFDS